MQVAPKGYHDTVSNEIESGRFEKDDVIKGAGRMMVQNLAGSLALVTCKEPLRHNMLNQLRGIIQKYFAAAFANEVLDSNALEPAVQMIAQDNLVSITPSIIVFALSHVWLETIWYVRGVSISRTDTRMNMCRILVVT